MNRVASAPTDKNANEKRLPEQEHPSAHGAQVDDTLVSVGCSPHKALLLSMAALGLFHPFRMANCGSRWRYPLAVYGALVATLLVFNSIRVAVTSCSESDLSAIEYVPRMTYITWHISTVVSQLLLYAACFSRLKGVAAYYDALSESIRRLGEAGIAFDRRRERTQQYAFLFIAWITYFIYYGYSIPPMFDTSRSAVEPLVRWGLGNSTTSLAYEAVTWLELVACAFASGAYIFPVMYFISVCGQLMLILSAYNKNVAEIAMTRPSDLLEHISHYRLLYGSIRKAIASGNGFFKLTIGLHLSTNFVLSMLQLWLLVNTTESSLKEFSKLQVTAAIWFVTSVFVIVVEVTAGIVVEQKASSCMEQLEEITDFSADQCKPFNIVQLQLFLNQIKQEKGFSAAGLLSINGGNVLPIIGAWLTYFLIIVQYGAPSTTNSTVPTTSASSSNCSC